MKLLTVLTIAAAALSGCTEDPGSSQPLQNPPVYTGEIFRGMSRIEQPDGLSSPVQIGTPQTNTSDGYTTVTTRYKAAPGFDELICLDPGSDTLWPGALLYGQSIQGGDYLPAITERAPVTLSVSLINIEGSGVKTVTNPSLSSIRAAVNSILAQNVTGSTPARTSFSIREVYNEDQLQLAVGGSYGGGVCSIKNQFDFSDRNIRSRTLVRFVQVYYTIDIDMPSNPGDVFSSSNAASEVYAQCGGISPIYVSSVSYGRLALFSFESTEESDVLKIAVSCAFNGLVNKGEANLTVSQQELLKKCVIKATVIGGNGGLAVHTINGLEGLKAFVLTGGNYDRDNPGAPLAYRLRYLSDNATCKVVFSSEYEITTRFKNAEKYRVYEIALHCDAENDAGDCEEFYGNLKIECLETNSGTLIQGYEDGSVVSAVVWNVGSSGSGNWSMKAGGSKTIPGERIFSVPVSTSGTTAIRITGTLKECDSWNDDNLGTRSIPIPLADLQEKNFTLSGFKNGGTRAHFEFRIRPM